MAQEFATPRPSGVTIVAVLVWLGAVFDLLAGLLLLIAPHDPALVDSMGGSGAVVTFGIISILLAVASAIVAFGLWTGNSVSRIAVTALEIIGLAFSIMLVFMGANIWNETVSALISLAIIALLWTSQANRFFKGLAPDEPDEPDGPLPPAETDAKHGA